MHKFTHTHTHTHTHISQIKNQAASTLYQKKLYFKKFHTDVAKYVYLYSYHLATLPVSWKFSLDKLSKS